MMDGTALITWIVPRDAIAVGRRDLPPPQNLGDGGKGGEGARGAGSCHTCLRRCSSLVRACMLLYDKRRICRTLTPAIFGCCGEAMSSEYLELWEDSVAREVCGVFDAGTFEPVYQLVETYIYAKWVFDCKAHEYDWPI